MLLTWKETIEYATVFRHELHANPELTWNEHGTAKRIQKVLDDFNIEWKSCAKTGTVATLAKEQQGKHIALRADIDALPIYEETNLPYASKNRGCMHACGHDGHSATLIATAIWLKQNENRLKNPVTLLFQPAEEGGHGAEEVLKEGVLKDVDEIYGWHNWPAIPLGQAVCPDGVIMAGNGTFEIELEGVGGHSSQPELCRDPILCGSTIVSSLQHIVSRRVPPQESAVVSVTSFEGKSGLTTIPNKVTLSGSIRISNMELRRLIYDLIEEICIDTAKAFGLSATIKCEPRYSPTINSPKVAHRVRELFYKELGDEWKSDLLVPIMASEDFSYYLQNIEGAFMLIGSGDTQSTSKPCHSRYYDFNDELIEPVCRIMTKLANLT
ncbi:MAG: N(2)-acetyl-L-2,4-diaminobutanoate deacetylase DoeB2 [Campylobacterales bacterium]